MDLRVSEANELVLEVAQEISHYLESHPEAADTLEGVVNWWLARQRYEYSYRMVKQALEHLVEEGKVARQVTVGGGIVYASARIARATH